MDTRSETSGKTFGHLLVQLRVNAKSGAFLDSPVFTNALAACIGFLALTQTLGYSLGWYDLEMLGKALMFSPMPRPFSALEGFDTLASKRTYTLHFLDGRIETMQLDDFLDATITGPHRRKIPYMQTLRFGPELPRRLTQNTFTYLFCNTEVYQEFTAKQEHLEYLSVIIHAPQGTREKTWEYPIHCTP